MNLTERELALIMVALDNTAVSLALEAKASPAVRERAQAQSGDMNDLWDRCHEERLHLLEIGTEERPPCPRCGVAPEPGDPAHGGYRCDCWQQ
jgi:hypothetical protein